MSLTKEEYDEIYLRALGNARPRVKPKPVLAANKGKEVNHTKPADLKPTEAVIDAATAHNNALTERLETMEDRRRQQVAKELAEFNAQNPVERRLNEWWLSVLRAQERIRALDGEIPERGIYDPIRRFEREMRGK